MTGYSPSPQPQPERTSRKPDEPAVGLDPVTASRFGDIIDADRVDGNFHIDAARPKRDQLSRATWVMIVIAGVVLGAAMAMIVAG